MREAGRAEHEPEAAREDERAVALTRSEPAHDRRQPAIASRKSAEHARERERDRTSAMTAPTASIFGRSVKVCSCTCVAACSTATSVPTAVATISTGKQRHRREQQRFAHDRLQRVHAGIVRRSCYGVASSALLVRDAMQRRDDRARRRRLVQRVEVDAGNAACEQLDALQRAVRDAEVVDGVRLFGARFEFGEQRLRDARRRTSS